jgi:hypothetical protein
MMLDGLTLDLASALSRTCLPDGRLRKEGRKGPRRDVICARYPLVVY